MLRQIVQGLKLILKGLLALPGDMLRWLRGSGGPMLPPAETPFEEEVEKQAAALRKDLIELPAEAAKAASILGQRVHAYAAGDRLAREGFDVASVPEHVALALLTIEPHQLLRLASAGPEACGRWAAGQKSGIVGVPACRINGNARGADVEPSAPSSGIGESLPPPGMRPALAA